jgi:hypothetical protein
MGADQIPYFNIAETQRKMNCINKFLIIAGNCMY